MRDGEYFESDIGGEAAAGFAGRKEAIEKPYGFKPERSAEATFFLKLGFSKPFVAELEARASANTTSIEIELLADGQVREDAYYGALARILGFNFIDAIDASFVADVPGLDTQLVSPQVLRVTRPDRVPMTLFIPSAKNLLAGNPYRYMPALIREKMAVTTPSALRQAVWQAGASRRVQQVTSELSDFRPEFSAKIVFWGSQGFWAGSVTATLAALVLVLPWIMMPLLHLLLSCTYFLSLVLRALGGHSGPKLTRPAPLKDIENVPIYTVLVALYQEVAVVPQLIDRLNRIRWPRSRLDIKLICEARDVATIAALQAQSLRPEYEIVLVPDVRPYTKPKALNYGLTAARGAFVVIYDAEDRPHPDQLREAYDRFSDRPPHVACLQAPLIVSNARDSWLSALFALEYAGLFRRLLPFLGSRHYPMPLGGTSNHFRIEALLAVGAWDPYNVTEDADLGMRLCRHGYCAEMLTRPTLEDAPTERSVWLGQRQRWFKGWMQSWLVIMRDPGRSTRELGLMGTIMFHMMISGMLISAFVHPLLFVFLAVCGWHIFHSAQYSYFDVTLFALDWVNLFGAYVLFAVIGYKAMIPEERRRLGAKWRYIPLYWMLMSWAAWRALFELRSNPFFWSKTPHEPSAGK